MITGGSPIYPISGNNHLSVRELCADPKNAEKTMPPSGCLRIKTCSKGSHFFEVFNRFFHLEPAIPPKKNGLSFNSTNVLQKLWLSTKQFHVLSWIAECLD